MTAFNCQSLAKNEKNCYNKICAITKKVPFGGEELENTPQKHPLNKKKIAMFFLYAIITVLLLVTVLSFNDLPAILQELKNVDVKYVLLAVACVLVYLALYPLSLCILTKARKCNVKMSTTYTIAMTEHFFNGITPLATGGQPFQAHSFSRAKVKISESTGLLLTNLIIYMMVTTGFSLCGLFFWKTITVHVNVAWLPIIIVGYVLNFMMMLIMFALGVSKTVRNWLNKLVAGLAKIKFLKFLEKKIPEISEYFEQVQESFSYLTKKKGAFLLATLTKILSFAFLYGSTFFILRAMNVNVAASQAFLVLSGTSFAVTAVGFIPTPGASGGVEASAGQVYKSIIICLTGTAVGAVAIANSVMLIWRLLSYYFVMGVSLSFYIGLEIYFIQKKKKERRLATENDEVLEEKTDESTEETAE